MNIGSRIRARRKELNMTQEELAEKMGYKTKSSINKIELGENDIPQSKVLKFAKVLNTSIAYLMGWDEPVISEAEQDQADITAYQSEKENRYRPYVDALLEYDFNEKELESIIDYAKYIYTKR